jgi:aminoglycoside phosphotransferase (APT) family kinase protein
MDDATMTAPLRNRDPLDAERLAQYLAGRIPGLRAPLLIEQFPVGQSNPTFKVTSADGRRYALRKKPAGTLLPSAHAIDREYRVIGALGAAGFPVAPPVLYCDDASIIGTEFYLMDFVDGRGYWDQSLPGMRPAERRAIWDELNRVIAQLHGIDFRAAGLEGYGKTGDYLARQIRRWSTQYNASATETIEAMDKLIAWLPHNIPPGDETSIVHGDFRLDNVIFHPTEPRIIAVLDWELSTLGHPLADFAYLAVAWHMPVKVFPSIAGMDHAALGIPTESEFVQAYCERTGRAPLDPAAWNYYIAYNLFRIAAISHGVGKRALEGNASSADGAEVGRKARPIAELAWRLVEQLGAGKAA